MKKPLSLRASRKKHFFYINADKGNTIEIMDEEEYDETFTEKLNNGNFHKLRKEEKIKQVEKRSKECEGATGKLLTVRVSNSTLPRIRCLPKIHKSGNKANSETN